MKKNPFKLLAHGILLPLLLVVEAGAADVTVIHDVRLFDGDTVHDRASVIIKGQFIDSVVINPSRGDIPDDAVIIDGRGQTLLPGLIDAHTHTFSRAGLERSLDFGVTTSIDMFTRPEGMRPLLAEQADQPVHDRADLVSAGMLVTAPGGHGTQFGFEIPTLGENDDASAFVADRIAEGSQFIKLIMDDFSVVGFDIPTLSTAQVNSVVAAAHEHDRLAVVHARDLEAYLASTRAGVDGFVHGLSESLPSKELLSLMAESDPFVIPTLTTSEGTQGGDGGSIFAEDEFIGPLITDKEKEALRRKRFENPGVEFDFSIALRSVGMMHAYGTRILAGTDAPNPGTTPGASLHRELELLTETGLTPLEALRAATANSANAFGLEDRGRIKERYRADLLLVTGDPTESITDSRKVRGIWKVGKRHIHDISK